MVNSLVTITKNRLLFDILSTRETINKMKAALLFIVSVVALVNAFQILPNGTSVTVNTPCAFTFDVTSQTTQVMFYYEGSVFGNVYSPSGEYVMTLSGAIDLYQETYMCITNIVPGTYFMNFTSQLIGENSPITMTVDLSEEPNQLSLTDVYSGSLCCGEVSVYYFYTHDSSTESFSVQITPSDLNKQSLPPNLVYQDGSICPVNFGVRYPGTVTVNYQGVTSLNGPATPGTYIIAIMNDPIYDPEWSYEIGVCTGTGCNVNFPVGSNAIRLPSKLNYSWLAIGILILSGIGFLNERLF